MPAHDAPAREGDPGIPASDDPSATPDDSSVTQAADRRPRPAAPHRGFRYASPAMPAPPTAPFTSAAGAWRGTANAPLADQTTDVSSGTDAPAVSSQLAEPSDDATDGTAPEVPAVVMSRAVPPAPRVNLKPDSTGSELDACEPSAVIPAPNQTPISAPTPVVAEAADAAEILQPAMASEATETSGAPAVEVEQPKRPGEDLLTLIERLRMHVGTLSLSLNLDGVEPARRERESLLSQLDDYLLPRLRRPDAPLLAVIGGSTGAGKSTLTNSLVRREVSRSGVLRPTTRSPVLIHHPYDSGAFMTQRILPRLERITSEGAEPLQPIDPHAPRITALRLVPHDGLVPGLALIDAPDIDSLVETNRDLAVQLLGAADLWVFVTTAARYADAMPWQMLKQAADRGVAVAVVLDRVPPESLQDLRVHLATRLRDRGLGGAPLFTIPETQVGDDGFLPERVVQPLLTWLRRVASDERSRTVIAERTLKGVVGSIPARAQLLGQAAQQQADSWTGFATDVEDVFLRARPDLLSSLADGSLVSGDVLARWQEHVADGALVRRLDAQNASLGDRVISAIQRDGEAVAPLDVPVTQAAAAAILAAMRSAMDEIVERWRARPGGDGLLAARAAQLSGVDLAIGVKSSLEDWRSVLLEAAESLAKRRGEQQVDPDAVIDVLFVATIDETTDGENGSGTANPTVAAARRILAALAGEEQLDAVVGSARADLVARAAALIEGARIWISGLLETGGSDVRRSDALLAAARAVEEASA